MRRYLLLLLIALLPLRAWAGDAMALAVVAAPGMAAAATPAPPCHGEQAAPSGHGAQMSPSSHGEQAAVAGTSVTAHTDDHGNDHSEHAACSCCDICHGSVLSGPVVSSSACAPMTGHPWPVGVRFASAVLPGQHKPPIS